MWSQPIGQGVAKLVHNQLDPRVPKPTKKFDEKDIYVLLTMKGCQQWNMIIIRYLENTLRIKNYITINLKIIMLLVINHELSIVNRKLWIINSKP